MTIQFCIDCNLLYGSPRWIEYGLDDDIWSQIAKENDLLCIQCAAKRLREKNLQNINIDINFDPFRRTK